MPYLIGIEIGTTRIKTGVYDLEGNQLCEKTKNYNLFFDKKTGIAEANPHDWWKAMTATLKEATSTLNKKSIAALCVGSHGPTLTVLDKNKKSIGNAILWLDKRASQEAEFISGKIAKNSNDLTWFVPRALWLKNNNPELFSKARYFVQPLDYVNYKLTGELKTIFASDSIKIWNDDVIKVSGIDRSMFPEPIKMKSLIGKVTKSVAEITGLSENIPVIAGTGGADFIEVLISSRALKPGIVCDRGGTSQGVNLCWSKPFNNKIFFEVPHPLIPGLFHISGLMATTGKSLQWYKELFYGKKMSYDKFFNDAANSQPGANKLIYLPYLTGERTPWWDANARGVFFGLSLEHKKEDIVRSILEGVGFGISHILNLFKQHGATITEIIAHGGQARSPLWNQIKADITGIPVITNKILDSSTFGLAILAGHGIGIYPDITEASNTLVKKGQTYEPSKTNHKIYSELQQIYEELYPSLKTQFKKLASLK